MDPEMMKMAMDAMSKMTPQQMAAMQQQMSSIPQSVLQEQMRNIQNLTPEQKRMAAQQAQSFDPSTLPSQTSQFAANATQRAFMDADSLKKEGNRLHGQGQYNSAVEKYQEASLRLQGAASPEARSLLTACRLNMASCYLNTGLYQKCIQQCNDVLRSDVNNLKALFRRGQAYLGQQSSQAAVSDLRQAVKLASHEEKGIIQAVLEKAESSAGQSVGQNPRADGQNSQNPSRRTPQEQAMPSAAQTPTNVEEPDSPSEHREADGEIEDINLTDEATASRIPEVTSSQRVGVPAAGQMPSMDNLMRDPETMRAMQNMMGAMSPDDMAAMQRQAASMNLSPGMSEQERMQHLMKDPKLTSAMQGMMSKMNPADIAAIQGQAGGMGPVPGGSQQEQMMNMMKDPEAMRAMQSMMASMKPEDMAAIQKQASSMGFAPGGGAAPGGLGQEQVMDMMKDPQTMRAMRNMMSSMKPEDMAALQKQAAGMQGMSGDIGSQTQQMQAMMKDPDAMKAVQNMMSSMEASDLAAMSRQAGMNISEEQAEQMASVMKKMSPEQMAKIMAAANFFQRLYNMVKRNRALVVGLVVLVLGIIWKLFFSR